MWRSRAVLAVTLVLILGCPLPTFPGGRDLVRPAVERGAQTSSSQTWTSPRGVAYAIPADYITLFPHIPDSLKEQFLTGSAELRATYARYKNVETNDPDAWARMQGRVEEAARQAGLSAPAALSPEYVLNKGLGETGRTTWEGGQPRIAINPEIASNADLLELALVREAAVIKARRNRTGEPGEGERARLEIAGVEAQIAAAQAKGLAETNPRFMGRLAEELDRRRAMLSWDAVIITPDPAGSATFEDLRRQGEQRGEAEKGQAEPMEHGMLFVIDLETGRIGFADNDAFDPRDLAERMKMDAEARHVAGTILYSPASKQWKLSITDPPPEFRRVETWQAIFRSLLATQPDSAQALDGLIPDFMRPPGKGQVWRFSAQLKRFEAIDASGTRAAGSSSSQDPLPPESRSGPAARPGGDQEPGGGAPPETPPPAPPPPSGPPTPPSDSTGEAAAEPGPSDPDFEKKIEAFLEAHPADRLERDQSAKKFDLFADEAFRLGEGDKEQTAAAIRAWKKVCSKRRWARHSQLLAEIRWEMVVTLWEKIALETGYTIELIDAGKRNAYRSDIDVTIDVVGRREGGVDIGRLIKTFEQEFDKITHYKPEMIDIQIHNAEVWMPSVRDSAQSLGEYRAQLRSVVEALRFKVTSGGDAYFVPGANLEVVQKGAAVGGHVTRLEPQPIEPRPIEPGAVTTLQPGVEVRETVQDSATGETVATRTALRVKRTETRIADLDRVYAERFRGLEIAYDRNNGFGMLIQSLEEVIRNGADPAAVAKQFNRGMNKGVGAGLANSFWDIHVSELSDPPPEWRVEKNIPGTEMIEHAFVIERAYSAPHRVSQEAFDEAHQWLEGWNPQPGIEKQFLKLRWIIRAFGINGSEPNWQAQVQHLYLVLETCADIEQAKIRNTLDWRHPDTGRSRYLVRHLEKARQWVERERPELLNGPSDKLEDAVYEEAWRRFTYEVADVLGKALVRHELKALMDITPEGMERNAFHLIYRNGKLLPGGAPNDAAAAKLAEQRAAELELLLEVIEKLDIDPQTGKQNPERKVAKEELRDDLLRYLPEEVRNNTEHLVEIIQARIDNYLRAHESEGVRQDNVVERQTEEVNRVAGNVVSDEEARALSEEEVNKDARHNLLLETNPNDASLLERFQVAVDQVFEGVAHVTPGHRWQEANLASEWLGQTIMRSGTRGFFESMAANATPLMVSSSLVNMARAYQVGGEPAVKEAAAGELMYYLPLQYGIVGIALKDFSRGQFWEGTKALITLGLLAAVPEVGHALLVLGIGSNSYAIIVDYLDSTSSDDRLEQAFKSRPTPGLEHAKRNPFKSAPIFGATDAPEFPVLWDNECVNAAHTRQFSADRRSSWPVVTPRPRDNTQDVSVADLIARSGRYVAPAVWKDLSKAGLTPTSSSWEDEWQRVSSSYAWESPYAERMNHLYACFFDKVEEAGKSGIPSSLPVSERTDPRLWEEDPRYAYVFGEVVKQWFEAQPQPYRDSITGRTRDRFLRAVRQRLGRFYEAGMYATSQVDTEDREVRDRFRERAMQGGINHRRILVAKAKTTKQVKDDFGTAIRGNLARVAATAGDMVRAWIRPPTWYVDLSFALPRFGASSSTGEPSRDDLGRSLEQPDLPMDVIVEAAQGIYKAPLGFIPKLIAVDEPGGRKPHAPLGFVPSEEQRQLLAEKGADGNPANAIYTVKFKVSADIVDADRRVIKTTPDASMVGYMIAPVPRVNGTALVRVHARAPSGSAEVSGTAVIGSQSLALAPLPGVSGAASALFQGLDPGSYSVVVRSSTPDFGNATGMITIPDPYSEEAYQRETQGEAVPSSVDAVIDIDLPYSAPDTSASQRPANPPAGPETPSRPGSGGTPAQPGGRPGTREPGRPGTVTNPNRPGGQTGATTSGTGTGQATSGRPPGQVSEPPAIDFQPRFQAINDARSRCQFAAAVSLAQALSSEFPDQPAVGDWMTANLTELQQAADAQSEAQQFLQQASPLIKTDLSAAIRLATRASQVPYLPPCAKQPIDQWLTELNALLELRQWFATMTQQIADAVNNNCDFDAARGYMAALEREASKDEVIARWVAENKPLITMGEQAKQRALALIAEADALLAKTPPECAAAIAKLRLADTASLACAAKLEIERRIADAGRKCAIVPPQPPSINPFDWSGTWNTAEATLTFYRIDVTEATRTIATSNAFQGLTCAREPDTVYYKGDITWDRAQYIPGSGLDPGTSLTGVGSFLACTVRRGAESERQYLTGLFTDRSGGRARGRFESVIEDADRNRFTGWWAPLAGGNQVRWQGQRHQ